jgi:AraC-like DNA-binding protein
MPRITSAQAVSGPLPTLHHNLINPQTTGPRNAKYLLQALNMSIHKPTSMVTGGEALRLKLFLQANKLPIPRTFYRVPGGASEAAEDRVGERMLVGALELAMRAINRPSLPVDFGSTIRPVDMGIYGMVLLTAPTVGDALERSVRFARLMTDTAQVYLEPTKEAVLWVWSSTEQRSLGIRIRNEVVLTEHVAVVRALAPGAVPRRVSFIHSEPLDCSAHRAFFDCPIAWSTDKDSVEWALDGLKSPMGTDPSLSAFIEKEAQRRLGLLPQSGSLDEVKNAVLQRLPAGDVSLITVAAMLGRAPRTLRRELSSAGCAYRSLVDGVRRQRAKELAAVGNHSMTDIALKLGFSEVSAFSRAWRRWFDTPFRAMNNY